jgi:probable HAF family extracellular repeat protein
MSVPGQRRSPGGFHTGPVLTRGVIALLGVLALILGPAAAAGAKPPPYRTAEPRRYAVIDLGGLGGPGGTTARAINDAGAVVGDSDTGAARHAFRWISGTMTDLGTLPGGGRSTAAGINEDGVIVGTAHRPTGEPRAVIWRDGVVVDLGLPRSHGLAVNDAGDVLALTTSGAGVTDRVLWRAGRVTGLGAETGQRATEGDLNNRGTVTLRLRGTPGSPWHAGTQHAGIQPAGTQPAGTVRGYARPGAAAAINNSGVVVGYARGAHGRIRPVAAPGGPEPFGDALRDLATLGGPDGAATAVNDRGVIAGYADTAAGQSRPVLWKSGRVVDLTTRGVPPAAVIADLNRPGRMIATLGYRSYLLA